MAVSIEVVDSRWRQYTDAPALLKLADLQAHGALVLGEWIPYQARDWASQRCHVRIGAQDFDAAARMRLAIRRSGWRPG